MDPTNIVVAEAQKTQGRLADLFPNEIEFFKRRFVWSSSTEGFYTRRAYEPITLGGFTIPKWSPYKTRGRCPIDRDLLYQSDQDNVREVEEAVTESEAVELSTCCPDSNEDRNAHSECFWTVDLKAITKAGQWVQFVKFLVENGFPCEDKFSEVVSTLALWLGFVELHGQDRERIRQVVRAFVLIGHNGKITRFNQGKTTEVLSHVDRIVDSVLDNEDQAGQGKFEDLRRRRKTGYYFGNYNFEPQILTICPI